INVCFFVVFVFFRPCYYVRIIDNCFYALRQSSWSLLRATWTPLPPVLFPFRVLDLHVVVLVLSSWMAARRKPLCQNHLPLLPSTWTMKITKRITCLFLT